MAESFKYFSELSEYNALKSQAEEAARFKDEVQTQQGDVLAATIGAPSGEKLISSVLESEGVKKAAKQFLKTGNQDVDNLVGDVIEGKGSVVDALSKTAQAKLQDLKTGVLRNTRPDPNEGSIELEDLSRPEELTPEEITPETLDEQPTTDISDLLPEGAGGRINDLSNAVVENGIVKNPSTMDFQDVSNGINEALNQTPADGIITGLSNAAETIGADVGTDAGIDSVLGGIEAAADVDPISAAVIGIPVAIAGIASSIAELFKKHHSEPSLADLPTPVFENGV